MQRLWKAYMADIHSWEQYARQTNDKSLMELVKLFKSNRLTALFMACGMFVSTAVLLTAALVKGG